MSSQITEPNNTSIKITRRISLSKRLFFFMALCVGVLIPLSVVTILGTHKYQASIYFLVLLMLAITSFFILNKKLVLFEPVVLFSAYYVTVVIAGFYSIFTDWRTNVFVNNTSFHNDITNLTAYTCMYFFVGYISMIAGYYLVKRDDLNIEFDLEPKSIISDTVLNIFIFTFLFMGVANFIYNIWIFAGGSLSQYMATVSVRHLQFAKQGTTIGYILAYNAMYIWLFKIIRKGKLWNKSFFFVLIITILMKASTGRIFGTMLYIASFIGIYYFIEISKKKVINNCKYYLTAIVIAIFGVAFYFMRIISSLAYNQMLETSVGTTFIELISKLGYYAVDKGNIPNVGVVLKIIDSWGTDIGYLYGQSLVTWITNILPSSFRPEAYQPSVIIKNVWYSYIQGGNLPPTGIGEMYANFGAVGPFLGMFFFGCLAALFYNYMIKSKSYWALAIYIQIAIGFIMIYPKGEFDNLTLWYVIPILGLVLIMRIVSGLTESSRNIIHRGDRHTQIE